METLPSDRIERLHSVPVAYRVRAGTAVRAAMHGLGKEISTVNGQRREEPTSEANLETARRYLQAVAGGVQGDELAAFYVPNVVQEEFANRLVPNGSRRGLADLLAGAERGQSLLSAQTYEVKTALADGNHVGIELICTGTLSVALGSVPARSTMRAFIAMVLKFRDGMIAAQRNYDCYAPF